MTSYQAPDYCAEIQLSNEQTCYCKTEFSVLLYRFSKTYPIKGMLRIFKNTGNKSNNAVLWIDSKIAQINLNQTIEFELLEPCNPMFIKEEQASKELLLPIKLKGKLTNYHNKGNTL